MHYPGALPGGYVGQPFDLQVTFLLKEYKPSRQNLSQPATSQFSHILLTKCAVSNVSYCTFCTNHPQLLTLLFTIPAQ